MKLFSWAHRKLLHNPNPGKTHLNSDRFIDPPKASNEDLQAAHASKDTHVELLTIGTLGMGNLLTMHANDDDDEEEEQGEEENHELAHNVSPNRDSANTVEIQKLQEELQKILCFKLGGTFKSENNIISKGGKRKNAENNRNKYNDGRSHVQGERRVFPLHSFLEMPMDALPPPPAPLVHKKQWLLQGLQAKLLHYMSVTRIKVSPSLFEKLIKPKAQTDLHHGSKVDKLLQLFRRKNKGRNDKEGAAENDEDGAGDDRLKLAVQTRGRGSERFINYNQNQLIIHRTGSPEDHDARVQLVLHPPPPANEHWINTDDEYLVLEI